MKKVIRLTESDLTRIVKRVMNEQAASSDEQKYQSLYSAVSGLGTNATEFFNVLKSIKDKAEYDRINQIAASKGEDIPELFVSEYEFLTDENKYSFCSILRSFGISPYSVKLQTGETCGDHRGSKGGVSR
jgi:hypothetical protein